MSANLASKHKLQLSPPSKKFAFSSVTGQLLKIIGQIIMLIEVSSGEAQHFYFEVTPDMKNEVILSYEALRNLKIVSQSFPVGNIKANSFIEQSSDTFENEASNVKDALCAEFRDVLGSTLP